MTGEADKPRSARPSGAPAGARRSRARARQANYRAADLGPPAHAALAFAKADAVLATWFLGSEAGNAVADVLSGSCGPTARLAVSWPVDVGQLPIFYAQRRSGRPADPALHDTSKYLDLPVEPMFAFGHGLSYTQFSLSNLRAGISDLTAGESLRVSIDVANTGNLAGEETLFLFVHDPVASIARPVLELAAIGKIALGPGETGTLALTVPPEAFAFLGADLMPRTEPGAFEILRWPERRAGNPPQDQHQPRRAASGRMMAPGPAMHVAAPASASPDGGAPQVGVNALPAGRELRQRRTVEDHDAIASQHADRASALQIPHRPAHGLDREPEIARHVGLAERHTIVDRVDGVPALVLDRGQRENECRELLDRRAARAHARCLPHLLDLLHQAERYQALKRRRLIGHLPIEATQVGPRKRPRLSTVAGPRHDAEDVTRSDDIEDAPPPAEILAASTTAPSMTR